MQEQIITIQGKNYKRTPELKDRSCDGCSFWMGYDNGCIAENGQQTYCSSSKFIWIPADSMKTSEVNAEQKFTVDEFVAMVHGLQCYLPEEIIEQLKVITDPEYKQYLLLKKKFG